MSALIAIHEALVASHFGHRHQMISGSFATTTADAYQSLSQLSNSLAQFQQAQDLAAMHSGVHQQMLGGHHEARRNADQNTAVYYGLGAGLRYDSTAGEEVACSSTYSAELAERKEAAVEQPRLIRHTSIKTSPLFAPPKAFGLYWMPWDPLRGLRRALTRWALKTHRAMA